MKPRTLIATLLLTLFCISSCIEDNIGNSCVKGRYIGTYCEGAIIEILDDNNIGIDWVGMFNSNKYTNSIVASIDTVFLSEINNREEIEKFILDGNTFYFQYKLGGYPRKKFNICEPSSFVTIFNISKNQCL
jgi:hypothetical protein